jgi:hypothetical protein
MNLESHGTHAYSHVSNLQVSNRSQILCRNGMYQKDQGYLVALMDKVKQGSRVKPGMIYMVEKNRPTARRRNRFTSALSCAIKARHARSQCFVDSK